jgi:hypothetical protein
MLHDKGTTKISELKADFAPEYFDNDKILDIFKAMRITGGLSAFDSFKTKGYSVKFVLSSLLLMIVHSKKTVLSSLPALSEVGVSMGKDVFYRLKNNEKVNWRRILWYIALKFVSVTESDSDEVDKPRYLIFDDTTVEKSGKKMEFLGRVWDHVKQRSILGFKVLVMLYWDGKSSIPLDFSIHREKGKRDDRPFGMSQKELRRQYSKKRVKESVSCSRVKELDRSKIEMTLKMFYTAVYHCLRIDYVLVDSWFTCESLVRAVIDKGIHLIGMYKLAKTKFLYKGEQLTYSEINRKITQKVYCRALKYYYKRADIVYCGQRMTLFFSQKGKKGNWKVFLTTDNTLSFIKMVEHYKVRWTIDVFNKEAKGLLNLGGCRSGNFDAQIADTTLSMIAYILLSFRFRYEHYESKGALFRSMNAESLRITLDRRLWGLFLETISIIADVLDMEADDLLTKVLTNSQCESMVNRWAECNLKVSS